MNFKGKTAIIAGDAWGLGHATALMFAREGAQVICIDDNADTKDARVLRMDEFELQYFHADVTDAAQVKAVADALEKTLAKVDILFNVGGRNPIRQTFEKTTLETWETMIGRNLRSAFLCSHAFLPLMKKAGSGAIIHHGSIDGVQGNPSIAAYSAGKGGLISLTHVMAHDLGKYNIRVNCLSTAGPRKTTVPQNPVEQSRVAVTPLRRQGTVHDTAPAVLFLASDGASFITGANLVIDGGRTATTNGCYEEA